MNDSQKLLQEITKPQPVDYEQIITQYSWWKSPAGRTFVVVWICLAKDESNNLVSQLYPDIVAILEHGKSETQKLPWQEFIKFIESGQMIAWNR